MTDGIAPHLHREHAAPPSARYAPWLVLIPVCAFLVAAPNVGIYYSAEESYDVWRGLQVALVVAVAAAFVLTADLGARVHACFRDLPARARGALAGAAALGLASSLLSARPQYALRQLALYALLFLLTLAVAAAARALGERSALWVAQAAALGAVFYLALFFAVLVADPWNTRDWSSNPFVGFASPRFIGQLQSWTIPLIVLAGLRRRGTRPLALAAYWTGAAGWWLLFLVAGSRAPALSLAAGMALAGVLFGRKALPWLAAQGAALAAGAVAYTLVLWLGLVPGLDGSAPVGVGSAMERGAGATGRIAFWRHAAALAERSPWLGVGPGNYAHFRPPPGADNPGGPVAHPHNAILQWAAEWGIPATLLVAGCLLWGMWSWVAARRREEPSPGGGRAAVSASLAAAATAAAVHSCFDGMVVMPLPQTAGAVAIGLMLGMHLQGRAGTPAARVPLLGRFLVVLAIAILLAALRLPTRVPTLAERDYPAFWADGAIP